jgi:hypothetical protein
MLASLRSVLIMSATHHRALLSTAVLPLAACGAIDDPDRPAVSPTISIISPIRDARVRGLVAVSADADAAGGSVASVQFTLPGGDLVTDREPPFSTVWDSARVADGSHVIRVTATDDQGAAGAAETTLMVANQQCPPDRLAAEGLPLGIPDGSPMGTGSSIEAVGNGRIVSLSLSLRITHPSEDDLRIKLISPAGSTFSIEGGDVEEEDDVITLDDQIVNDFNGQAAEGAWTLVVQDGQEDDTGTLDAWSLAITTDCVTRTP